ncbi:MAG: tetratricopeptide repeat protein [Pseudomonadota bacterium]
MRISNFPFKGCAVALAVAFAIAPVPMAQAFDPESTFKADDQPRTILRFGYQALKQGNVNDAIGAFRFGAARNNLAAEWKLARMFQRGEGVAQDHVAAHELFTKIAMRYAETPPNRRDMPFVSHAVVSLGKYALTGIRGTAIGANKRRAEDYFYRAAALYKDPEAQFQLGLMYRNGDLGVVQARSAARWFGLAARKGHGEARAQLGEMLFYGEGVRRSPVRGLVHMARGAARSKVGNAQSMLEKALAEASTLERQKAEEIIAQLDLQQPTARARANAVPLGGVTRNAVQSD